MSEYRWGKIKDLLSANSSDTLQWMVELERCEGWKHIMRLIEREAQSMRHRASTTGIDHTATGQVINHNRNVYTAAGLLSVKGLVREIRSQAVADLEDRPDAAR